MVLCLTRRQRTCALRLSRSFVIVTSFVCIAPKRRANSSRSAAISDDDELVVVVVDDGAGAGADAGAGVEVTLAAALGVREFDDLPTSSTTTSLSVVGAPTARGDGRDEAGGDDDDDVDADGADNTLMAILVSVVVAFVDDGSSCRLDSSSPTVALLSVSLLP